MFCLEVYVISLLLFYNFNVPSTSKSYFVRVSASNDRGYGAPVVSTTSVSARNLVPGPVLAPTLVVISGNQLQVNWQSPSQNLPVYGGDGGRLLQRHIPLVAQPVGGGWRARGGLASEQLHSTSACSGWRARREEASGQLFFTSGIGQGGEASRPPPLVT